MTGGLLRGSVSAFLVPGLECIAARGTFDSRFELRKSVRIQGKLLSNPFLKFGHHVSDNLLQDGLHEQKK